ncbi:hypothetical protein [Pseudomonas palleroniana]|uniref:hypothetical protein n=1 Tax=Pseudomonas palleroniana TaxID=191390 RepID=UPI001FD0867A|nr:hypothetical protein [Pseudomonas palleroniana]UOP13243.1 hypothetical protein LDL65_12030 [Pseudomonas palleroniana]
MDSRLMSLRKQLAKMTSDQAAAWILSRYPLSSDNWGEALLLLPHRSWKRPEQKRLADYYFKKIPFSRARGYEVFASIMSIKLMVSCINDALPKDPSRIELLFYHLIPVLKRFAKNDADRKIIEVFLSASSIIPSKDT